MPFKAAGITCELLCKYYEWINREMILSLGKHTVKSKMHILSIQFDI